jgi:uncharacterized integral membrane protein
MNKKRTGILILLAVVAVFALQNTSVVDVRFLFWTVSMSRILLVLVLLAVGILLGWLANSAWRYRRRELPGPPPS